MNKYKLIPADRENSDAVFMSSKELEDQIGVNPQLLGFKKTRERVNQQQRRGYWVKK